MKCAKCGNAIQLSVVVFQDKTYHETCLETQNETKGETKK